MKINPQHKAVNEYYHTLQEVQQQGGTNEEALRRAFQGLLVTFGRERGWILMEEQRLANGSKPDGTLIDRNTFKRGFWEAKDAKDDLETEIKKKIARGYPLTNTIFEDTRRAVLYQQGQRVDSFDLTRPQWLTDLLEQFFSYTEPAYERYDQAAEEFKGRIPDLAGKLLALITQERAGKNKAFQRAFEEFHTLCRGALNPQISVAAIDEMLVQHLLTERLFRTIFDNNDFVRRNVIAAEIEKVIAALTSRAFDRSEFLKGLDHFYVAIEEAARTIGDWTEKQGFLNTVYERFFQGYSIKQADTYGIVYTPQEIVDFMVASVDDVLRSEFGKDLSSPGVQILDPCTGTGNFIVNILRRVSLSALEQKYRHDLFANEIMLLPYYIASLNIEHAYYERAHSYLPFDGLCFVDTLELAESQQMSMFVEENTARVERQKEAEITVVIGNPPYNVGQMNENDNNKNRSYDVIDKRVRDTYVKDSTATLRMQVYDPYVKFFRWATDRLQGRNGIVCFVSNNSFIDQLAFDGMRKHLLRDFTQIYHLDLHGNVRLNPKISGTTHNVFGIQVGVGITIAVRALTERAPQLRYFRVPPDWRKTQKLAFLAERRNLAGIEWQELEPDEKATWLTEGMRPEFASFLSMGTSEIKAGKSPKSEAIFKTYSSGVVSGRDSHVYSFNKAQLVSQANEFVEIYNRAVDSYKRRGKEIEFLSLVDTTDAHIKWTRQLKASLARLQYSQFSESHIRNCLYRPFTHKNLYFDDFWNEERYQQHLYFPTPASEAENAALVVSDRGYRSAFSTLAVNAISERHLVASTDVIQCFPFYTYNEDGSGRRENITEWALEQFRAQYGPDVGKWDIFHYVYALLHHPQYRQRYAENLKRELPRIPLVADGEAFAALVSAGARLKALHLGYEQAEPYPLRAIENPKASADELYRVTKMRLSPDKTALAVNDALTLAGIPADAFQYRLGNRSALEWVIDQYQVSTDARSGITSDPNRDDEPDYIVQLARRVVSVSLETAQIVSALPPLPEPDPAIAPTPAGD